MRYRYSKLRPSRRRSGFTQEELAYLVGGKKSSTISRYEGGGRKPDLRTALAFKFVFARNISDLFPGVHEEVFAEVKDRAKRLSEEIERQGDSAKSKYKLAKLARLQNETRGDFHAV
jgi:DNA-binding XRE family transcriptional regulator